MTFGFMATRQSRNCSPRRWYAEENSLPWSLLTTRSTKDLRLSLTSSSTLYGSSGRDSSCCLALRSLASTFLLTFGRLQHVSFR